jgi:hypothetical protein
MNYPEEFLHRIYKTRFNGMGRNPKKLDEIVKDWPGSEIDVVYENLKPIVVIVFETAEDNLSFTLQHGDKYV